MDCFDRVVVLYAPLGDYSGISTISDLRSLPYECDSVCAFREYFKRFVI